MNLNKTGSEMLYFPPEIIRNILKRLPVKSLIRFQCVCKHWKNLIKNPSFIADHLRQSSHQNPSLIFKCDGINLSLRFRFLNCRFQVGDVEKAPLSNSLEAPRIVGSCNGLICLETYKFRQSSLSLSLWNPATSAVRHVPITTPDILLSDDCVTGFGFSEVVNDFKIVRTYAVPYETVNRVEVFSLTKGTWKVIDIGNLKDVRLRSEAVTVNGAIFWSGVKQDSEEGEDDIEIEEDEDYMEEGEVEVEVIVSFDIAKEVFSVIPRPFLDYNEKLTIYENKLAILCDMWDYYDETPGWIYLWVLDEGTDASGKTWSWTNSYSSGPLSCTSGSMAILGNEIVCKSDSAEDNEEGRNVLRLINVATNEVKRLSIPYCGSFHSIYNYVESLVSVGNN